MVVKPTLLLREAIWGGGICFLLLQILTKRVLGFKVESKMFEEVFFSSDFEICVVL